MNPMATGFSVAVALAALAAPAAAQTRFLDPVFPVAVQRAVPYGAATGRDGAPQTLLLDVYRPRGDARVRRPAMLWVHGGAWSSGSRSHRTLRLLAAASARRGYVALSVDYRLLRETGCFVDDPACAETALEVQHDVQAAVRWVRANAGRLRVDPNRIAVGGTSVGGTLGLLTATRPEDPGGSGNPGFSSRVRAFVSIAGGWPGDPGFATAGDPPGLLFHTERDRVTPFSFSADAHRALRRAGVPSRLVRLPGRAHVATPVFAKRYVALTHRFLYRRLGLAPRRQVQERARARPASARLSAGRAPGAGPLLADELQLAAVAQRPDRAGSAPATARRARRRAAQVADRAELGQARGVHGEGHRST